VFSFQQLPVLFIGGLSAEPQLILSSFIKSKQVWSSVLQKNSYCVHIHQIDFKFSLGKTFGGTP